MTPPQHPAIVISQTGEPLLHAHLGPCEITLLGTAHVSRSSAEAVQELLATGKFDAVAVELCPGRHRALVDPDSLERMNLFEALRTGRAPMIVANLALGAFQQRLAEQFGIQPGAEMRAAIETARDMGKPVVLIDRDIGVTLKRVYHNVSWWRRLHLIAGLLGSLLSREEIREEDIERLKEGDILESAFAQFATEAGELYEPLIDERDRYMAARIQAACNREGHPHLLAVVGAGHLQGIRHYLNHQPPLGNETIEELDKIPPASRWPRVIPWFIVVLIATGFVLGFRRSPTLGWELVSDWVVINGGLAAIGALLATAHPLTILGAFVAAPLTSLNPMIGAGMVTAALELFLRKPNVGDFGRLRKDTVALRGWWRNGVARILLVFLFSTMGSAVGTYLAGFRIADRLIGS
jgi:pheromone shutdown-related protein TraB